MESVECRECIYDVQKDIADRKSLRTPDKMAGFFFLTFIVKSQHINIK